MTAAQPDRAESSELRRIGKYELIERIGIGGMAEVFLARMRGPMNFQKVVVVKTIHPNLASQPEFIEMLLDEARVSALIKHPRVVDIYDLGCVEGRYFIAMEYLDGQPLSAVLAAGANGRPLDIYSTSRIIADAAEGLHAAHELRSISGKHLEVVHRDVSPGNIIVLYDGSVKLVDFGVAKARGRLTQSGVQQLKGKLGYMAPEQIANRDVDRRSDIFSLGVVMWESLALARLFPPPSEGAKANADESTRNLELLGVEPPSRLRAEVPAALDAVCMRALAAEPQNRFQTAEEMKLAIEEVLRSVGYNRDSGHIGRYTRHVFSRRRKQRSLVLRRLGTNTQEFYPDTEAEGSDADATPAASTVGGEGSARRWKLLLVAALLLVLGGGAAAAYLGIGTSSKQAASDHHRRRGRHLDRVTQGGSAGSAAAPTDHHGTPTETVAPIDAGAAPATPDAATEQSDDGDHHHHHHDDDKKDPAEHKSARALYNEGADLFVRGKLGAAKKRFKEALRVDRRHAPAHRGLGLVYQAQGRKRSAISAFQRYLRLRPHAADAASIRARLAKLQK